MRWSRAKAFGAVVAAVLAGCGGGGSAPAPSGQPRPALANVASVLAPGATCPAGGVQLFSGFDDNGNGVLEASEIDATEAVCHGLPGVDGKGALVAVTAEPAGVRCAAGGLRIEQGIDDDRDAVLDPAEVDGTSYVCHGRPADAAPLLVTSAPVGAGTACPAGGFLMQSGADDDGDGVLEPGEVDASSYVCHGAAAGALPPTRIRVVVEPAGGHCAEGGLAVQTGLDDDGDGALSLGEVDSTEYLCNAAGGSPPGPGVQPVTPLPLTLANGMGGVTGALASGDRVLPDGGRADFYTFTVAEPGVLEATSIPGGAVEFHVFTQAALAIPDPAAWGTASVGRAGPRLRLAAGSYVLLVKDGQAALPWIANGYQAVLRYVSRPGPVSATLAEHLRQGDTLLQSLTTSRATDDFLGAVEHYTAAAALIGLDATATPQDLDRARFFGAAARLAVLAQPYSDEAPGNGLRDLGDLLDAFGYGGTAFERSDLGTIKLVSCVDRDPYSSGGAVGLLGLVRFSNGGLTSRYLCSFRTLPADSPRAQELQEFLHARIGGELRAAIGLLEGIGVGFSTTLDFPFLNAPIELDRTDALALEALAKAALFTVLYQQAYDVDTDLVELQANAKLRDATGARRYDGWDFLREHPFFLRLKDAATLPESRASLLAAVRSASAAIDALQAETDDQADDLFRLIKDTCGWDAGAGSWTCATSYNAADQLAEARLVLSDAEALLDAPGVHTASRHDALVDYDVTVDASRLFGGLDLRALLPGPGGGARGDLTGLFPDPTFGGVLPTGQFDVNKDVDLDGSPDVFGVYSQFFAGWFAGRSWSAPPFLVGAWGGAGTSAWGYLAFDPAVNTFALTLTSYPTYAQEVFYGVWTMSGGVIRLTFAGPGPGGIQSFTAAARSNFETDAWYGPLTAFEYFGPGGAPMGAEELFWSR